MIRLLSVTAVLALLACAPPGSPGAPPVVAEPVFGERWMVINYWAIWCAPCREEVPELNTLARRGLVDVYAVNFDNVSGQTLLDQAAELGIQFPLLSKDPGPGLGIALPTMLPTTLILTPTGDLKTRLMGSQTVEALEREIASAMQSTPEG